MCSNLAKELRKEISEWCLQCHFGVSIINFGHGLHYVSVVDFELVNVNRYK